VLIRTGNGAWRQGRSYVIVTRILSTVFNEAAYKSIVQISGRQNIETEKRSGAPKCHMTHPSRTEISTSLTTKWAQVRKATFMRPDWRLVRARIC